MPNVRFIVHSDSADASNGVRVFGVKTWMKLKYLPGLYSFSTTYCIDGFEDGLEGNTIHVVQLELFDPKGKSVTITTAYRIELPDSYKDELRLIPPEKREVIAVLNWNNVEFEQEGEYTVKLSVDEHIYLASSSFYVVRDPDA